MSERLSDIDIEIKCLLIFMEMQVVKARQELESGDGWLSDHREALCKMNEELHGLLLKRNKE
jgi:hypothetical protein